jgi:hypothetical protein
MRWQAHHWISICRNLNHWISETTMGEDELFKINAETQAQLWAPAAIRSLASMKHEKRQRYEELLIKLRERKVSRLTQLDREVDKLIAAAKVKQARPEVPDDGFERDGNGAIMSTQGNIRLAVDKLGVKLRYDEFRGTPVIEGLDDFGPWLDDPAMTRLWLLIDEQFGFRPRRDFFDAVVSDACQRGRFHPVRDYLDALSWDGKPRLDGWLVTYFGAEDQPYVRAVGAIVLMAAVRRVRKPGSKFDEMMVWEGPQGQQKSSALATMAVHSDWFSDSIPLNAKDKELIEGHGGKWICEIADLQGKRKAEVERVKAALSRQVDRARLAYARLPVEVPRQCIFVGTTNGKKYLTDQTGNRRFWPIRVMRVDIEGLRRDRDQLWAEAAVREAKGESIRLAPEHWPAVVAEQAKRLHDNPFLDALAAAIQDRDGILFVDDAYALLGIQPTQRTQEQAEKLGEAMRELGFEYAKRRRGGAHAERAWVKGATGNRFLLTTDHGRRWLQPVSQAVIDALPGDDPF